VTVIKNGRAYTGVACRPNNMSWGGDWNLMLNPGPVLLQQP
jgi:hypothetical protein